MKQITMEDAIAAGDGTLHGAIDYWQDKAFELQEREKMLKELADLLEKRSRIQAKMMERYHNHSATRARATTASAETGKLNERIVWLREQLKTHNARDNPPAACGRSG